MTHSIRRLQGAGILIFVLAILIFPLVQPTQAQGGTVVRVVPDTASVHVGDTVAIWINVDNVTNLFGVELQITFDANYLDIVDADTSKTGVQVEHGGFLSPDFVATNTVSNGVIKYTAVQVAPHEGVNGSGTLIKITFKGKANGTSAITLNTALLSDPGGGNIGNTLQNGSVTVGETAPEPTATPQPGDPTATPPTAPTATPAPITPVPTVTQPPAGTPMPTPTLVPVPGDSGTSCDNILGYHEVRQGETLYSIGRAYATRPKSIATCNHLINPGLIHAGTRLAIPHAPWWPVPPGTVAVKQFTPGTVPAPTPPSPTCRYMHTVQRGETLTRIGLRYGVSIWDIANANDIQNMNLIYAGQSLCIP